MENNETKRRFYVQTAMQDNIKYYYTSVSNVKLCNVDIKLSAHDAILQ